ncbi:hypothetical protein [Erythrobacter oryzae]|uniref:hypothetical protein n=1 Tax=Erythrobacter oryzae TaxID=3019556 RepID=UPI0025565486|nr:hypothetical protein [Erythrobacter sp. COR-2]
MRSVLIAAGLGIGLLLDPPHAGAKTLSDRQIAQLELETVRFTCPLGGETFRQAVTHPHFPLDGFPDGSHLGDEWIDQVIPECPGNSLLILPDYAATPDGAVPPAYYSYRPADLERLPGLLASADWQALKGQTRTLRAYWLATQVNLPAEARWELLLHASWGAETVEQRRTAFEWLLRDGPSLVEPVFASEAEAIWARERIANAARELGRFEVAAALSGREDALAGMADEASQIFGDDPMSLALGARDDDRYAIDLLSDGMASRVCNLAEFAAYRGPHAAERCAARDRRAQIREAMSAEAFELGLNTAALDASCAETPEASRSPALALACDDRQSDLAGAEADRMLELEADRVAEACWAGPPKVPTMTAMDMACSGYRRAMGGVVQHLLVRDPRAFAVLCEEKPVTYEEDDAVNLACSQAADTLADIGALAMWKDLPALRRYCAKTGLEQRSRAGIVACVWTDYHDAKNPPEEYALEYLNGPMFFDALSEHAVPYARKLVDKLIAERGGA